MFNNIALNCTPLNPKTLPVNKQATKPAFGSDEVDIEEPEDSLEINKKETDKKEAVKKEPDVDTDIEDIKKEQVKEAEPEKAERKFSAKNAKKNFKAGFLGAVDNIIDHPIEAVVGAVVGGVGLKVATKKIPKLSVLGVALLNTVGVLGLAKGAYKFATADNVEKKEASFEDMGKGTFYTATSFIPANFVAKRYKLPQITEKSNPLECMVACWKDTGKIIKNFGTGLKEGNITAMKASFGIGVTDGINPDLKPSASIPDKDSVDNIIAIDVKDSKKPSGKVINAGKIMEGEEFAGNYASGKISNALEDFDETKATMH